MNKIKAIHRVNLDGHLEPFEPFTQYNVRLTAEQIHMICQWANHEMDNVRRMHDKLTDMDNVFEDALEDMYFDDMERIDDVVRQLIKSEEVKR